MVRIGIIGTGRIAKRFLKEAEHVADVVITAVYNPHISSSVKFSELSSGIIVAKSLDDLWSMCDGVYIATPHETHSLYVEEALLNDKHVICEKPMFLNGEAAEELVKLAHSKKIVMIEAIKTKYCPGYKNLIEVATSGAIGEIVDIDVCFTKLEDPSNRELVDVKYGGSFRELGSYAMLPILDLFGENYIDTVFNSINKENGIDLFTRAFLKYEKAGGTIKVGLGAKSEGELIVTGTKGYIVVRAPWWKTNHFEIRYEDPSKSDVYKAEFEGDGLRYELAEFCNLVKQEYGYQNNDAEGIVKRAEIMEEFSNYHD